MALQNVRDYVYERAVRETYEYSQFQKAQTLGLKHTEIQTKRDYAMVAHQTRDRKHEIKLTQILQSVFDRMKMEFRLTNFDKREPFELFTRMNLNDLPSDWQPTKGIEVLPYKYHKGRVVNASETVPSTGHDLHPRLKHLLRSKYPQFLPAMQTYCRPLSTTIDTFKSFNKEQTPKTPVNPDRRDTVIRLIKFHLNVKPYLPVHFVDTQWLKMPLNTAAGYNARNSSKSRAHAKFSAPEQYFKTRETKSTTRLRM